MSMEVTPDKFLWLFLVVATLGWILFKYVFVCPSSFFPFPFGNAFSLLELRVYCSCFLSRGFLGPGFRLVKEDWIGWVPVDLLPLSPSVSMCLGPCLRCVIEGEEI